jgi:RHH-type proline utilization regulon transcriptional repressor/proline dehydrogenase/delta 1-pyrroline-5-carboxylate dehydrogenase
VHLPTTIEPAERVRALLETLRDADASPKVEAQTRDDSGLIERASVALAEELARDVERETRRSERSRHALLARLAGDRAGQAFTTSLTDRAYRSRDSGRIVDVARQLLRQLGIPGYLPAAARAQLKLLLHAGPFVPGLASRGMLHRLRSETRDVVLDASPEAVRAHLTERYAQGVRVNLNYLGEAVLGERAAAVRCDQYLALLARPEVRAISVKLSSIVRPFELLAWEETLEELRPRLRSVYRAALQHRYPGKDGSTPKLVSLDMEAYRDLELTFGLFRGLLDEPELMPLPACLVLQAYLPDAFALQRELTRWAQDRVARGGAPVRLRLVKGANLAAEQVESASRGWALPMFGSKLEVDANYKRMLEYACRPEHARALELGIASHNLFDIALGLVLRAYHGVEAHVGFELLEGMADPLRRVLSTLSDDVLVYCPIVDAGSMQTAIAYLMRRLDENLAPENFLRKSFSMRAGDADWQRERDHFTTAFEMRNALPDASLRTQDRSRPAESPPATAPFSNEPDTDFALAPNRRWIWSILNTSRKADCIELPATGATQSNEREFGFDPSRPDVRPYSYALATPADIERVLSVASASAAKLTTTRAEERAGWLVAIARELRAARGELIAAMVLDAGKRVEQADAEVSEAIDFAEYYARSFLEHASSPRYRLKPRGVVLVTPPWNFPLAIPAGGVLAGLVAGNAVILKPALETVLVAQRLAEACWRAGVPPDALQFVVCADEVGSKLVSDSRVSAVVLTGASSTARLFQTLRPGIRLFAETGGKNAVVVTAAADRDAAIKDVLHSAFGHSGQKCSAASVLICEAEVYDDPSFREVLGDAVASLPVGSAWDLRSIVTPLIQPPGPALSRALNGLEPGEKWLVEPRIDPANPRLVSPGVKLDVAAGSFTHTTELFGPVLAVMRADDLEHALSLANATSYGLTAGLFSLDEREQQRWSDRMQAGNLYVNRSVTGAIVRRQPFGGWKASSFGPGAKAGGPNYVLQLCEVADADDETPEAAPAPPAAQLVGHVRKQLAAAEQTFLARRACSYAQAHAHFARAHDPSALPGERNLFRYLPCDALMIRAAPDAVIGDVLLACVAALTAGAKITLSLHPQVAAEGDWLSAMPLIASVVEDSAAVAARVGKYERVRNIGGVEPALRSAAEEAGVHLASEPVLHAGRIEILHYVREQSVSALTHRYGSLHAEELSPFRAI